VLALLADHDARTRGLDGDVDALGGALDLHAAHGRIGELLLEELAHADVGVHVDRELLLAGVPLGHPVAGDAEASANGIDLLTHDYSSFLPSPTTTVMWLLRLMMRVPRPLALEPKRLNCGAASTMMRVTFRSSTSAPWLFCAFSTADQSTLCTRSA